MNEPKHAHFILADAQYCHVLDDKLVIGKREIPERLPVPSNKLDYLTLIFQIAGILLLTFFLIMTLITKYYVITFTLSLFIITLGLALVRSAGFTSTNIITKADIVGVDYRKKAVGYDYFIIHYSGPGGKLWKRRLAIYDSQIALDQALSVMKHAGLLK